MWKDVFLNYANRSYKNVGHRWEVAANCMAVFYRILESYEIKDDVKVTDAQRDKNSFISLAVPSCQFCCSKEHIHFKKFYSFLQKMVVWMDWNLSFKILTRVEALVLV